MSSNVSDDYKTKYDFIFGEDLGFAQRLMPEVIRILQSITLPISFKDNMGTAEDSKGHDLTGQPFHVGVRVRRQKYKHYKQFTQDDKERETMSCDLYFFGYATDDEQSLDSYLIFDGRAFEAGRGTERIPVSARCPNHKHSQVWFNCYDLADIEQHCAIYAQRGMAGIVQQQLTDF